MSKEPRYIYDGKVWSDENLSLELENYGGDLYDLYCELKKSGFCDEVTVYYALEGNQKEYCDDYEEMLEDNREYFEDDE